MSIMKKLEVSKHYKHEEHYKHYKQRKQTCLLVYPVYPLLRVYAYGTHFQKSAYRTCKTSCLDIILSYVFHEGCNR